MGRVPHVTITDLRTTLYYVYQRRAEEPHFDVPCVTPHQCPLCLSSTKLLENSAVTLGYYENIEKF